MDKEQAIEKLNDIRCHVKETSAEEQALVMAIDALKQPVATDTNVGDTISRQAAIDAIDKQIKQCCKALGSLSLSDVDKHAVEVEMASLRAYRGMLENLPTIQPEPQEGHWIWVAGRP